MKNGLMKICTGKRRPSHQTYWLVFSLLALLSLGVHAQTPVTQYPCDPRSTANAGTCPVDCVFPVTIERGCNCFDNIDNDGDGLIDSADPNCASYFGLEFVGEGSDCSIVPPGANTPFDLVGPPAVSGQNTADTQSKVAAGDVDGNGYPDVVITSKWNSEVRLVATAVQPGFSPGNVKADFNLDGNTGFFQKFDGIDVKNLLFEHEVLIADINKDGKAEIFCVVSNRQGSPTSPPKNFYLLALRFNGYGPGGLQPMYNAVYLGKNRPGTFGIADMDGDGRAEIYLRDRIFAAETGALLASEGGKLMTGTGTDNWDVDVTSAPVAVDIRSAGADGFVMELVSGSKIYKIPSLTNRNPGAPGSLVLWRDMNSITFDINGDGVADKYFVKLMNDPDEYGIDTHSSTSVADIDKDGFVDVVVTGALNSSTGRTTVFYWNVQDNTVTGFMTPTSAQLGIPNNDKPAYDNYLNGWIWGTGRVNIGDADGDGLLDLLFVAGNQLFCFTTNAGNGLVQKWVRTINDSRSGVLTVTIYDFDNDGNPEVVYRDSEELAIVDGATGSNKLFSRTCRSHTYTEGPIIADVNGDGNTDICVSCNRSDNPAQFNINAGIQQQALGEVRIFFSDGEWLPTRKVWNQPGYFVVNINDDLTLPFPQLDIAAVFSNTPCPNGLPGPQTPYNVFLNQVPFLSANGCPVFPAPDLTFIGQDPNDPLTDPSDPGYFPTVFAEAPICGNIDLKVGFNISNSGDLPINTSIPVSFFLGSPYDANNTGTLLHSTSIVVNNLRVGDTLSIGDLLDPNGNLLRAGDLPFIEFDGPGTTFDLYVVLYNDGSILPIDTTSINNGVECDITNNFWPITIVPRPFTVNIDSLPNVKCLPTSPDSGGLISHISVGADTVIDLSPYAFQWFLDDGVTPAGTLGVPDTNYDIQGLPAGDYYLVITNTEKGCSAPPVLGQVVDGPLVIPGLTVTKISDQTSCEPPNGELRADVTGGNAGFEFLWEDVGGPIGVTGPVLENVRSGTYTVVVTETQSGCSTEADGTILDFTVEPDLTLSAVDVVNCVTASSGSVTARPSVGGVERDTLNYRFDWYFYDKATNTRGSILPGNTGNPTVKNLPVGHYEVVVTEIATGCNESNVAPDTIAIRDLTILPEARFTELAPQTSCDPLQSNGRLQADAFINGVLQNPADFTFEWFEGQNTITPHTGGTSGINGQIAEGVKGGGQSFTVRITTANQCSVTKDTVINEIINYPLIALSTTPNSVCDQALGFTGSVLAAVTFGGNTITAGTPDYIFEWYDGPIATGTPVNLNQQNYVNLDSGFYTLVVRNTVLHCPSVATVEQVLSIKALPVITASSIASTNCDPALANGVAQVTDVDGAGINSPDYTFEWYNGNVAAGAIQATTPAYGNNTPGNGLQGGAGAFFTTLVRNITTGCENTATVLVGDASELPVLTLAAQDNTVCDPALTNPPTQFTGSVTATVTNQVGVLTDYAFVFGGGNTAGVQANNIYSQLNGGPDAYTAVATHTPTGCVSSLVSIPVQNVQDIPDLTTASIASTNCTPGLENGEASVVTVDGVAAPGATYTYAWTGPGSFPVTNAANNANTHQLTAVQGGAGFDYTVLVTNQVNGCQSTALVNVADARVIPVLALTPASNSICDPAIANTPFNGQVSAAINNIPSGSTLASYFFEWSTGTTGNGLNVLTGLDVGSYTVTALHVATGCESAPYSAQVTNAKVLPVITTAQTPSQNCAGGAPDGVASVVDVLPVGQTYDYRWFNGNTVTATPDFSELNTTLTTSNYNNIQGGLNGVSLFQYTVEVTIRESGCVNTAIVAVDDDSQLPVVSLTSIDNENCVLPANGSAAVNTLSYRGAAVASPYTGFTFSWSAGGTVGPAPGDTYTALPAGAYTLTVTNTDDNCISNPVSVDIQDNLFIPEIEVASIDQTSCDPANPNGELLATIDETAIGGGTGVTAGYSFQWTNDVTAATSASNQITGLRGNQTYTIRVVRPSTGCSNEQVITLDENITIPVVSAVVTDLTVCVPPDGSISASALPAATYDFFWYDGSDAIDENAVIAGASQAGPSAVYAGLIPGNYTVVARDVNTRCVSNLIIRTVNDASPAINLAITNVQLPTDCNAVNSQMDATANGVTAGYTFDWYNGVPQPTDPLLGSIDYFTNPPVYTPPATVGTGSTVNGFLSGLYTLEVTDQATGCKVFLPHSLPFQNSHAVIKITKTDSELCPYTVGNGSITIEIENPVAPPPPAGTDQTDYNIFLYPGSTVNPPIPTLLSPSNRTTEPVLPFLVSNTLIPGSYIVGVQETYSGSDCFIYQDVIIEAVALDPIITLASSIVSNTACDVTQFDGSIEINVDKDPNDPVAGLTYDIDMISDPNNAFPIVGVPAGNYQALNLGPNTYTFNVTASNGCTAARAFTVLDNPVVSQFVAGNLSVSDAQYCDPILEQSARVTISSLSVIGGGPEVIADYQFAWDNVTNNIPNVFVAQGDALNSLTGGDEFINQTPLPASGTVPAGTVRAGTYRVRATKTADASGTGGIGCTSAPYTITIGSNTVNPQLTLTPFGDTSCDPTFFEGSIQVDVVTSSGPGNGGTYTYQWTPTGGAGQPTNSIANTGVSNLFTDLNDGNYSLTAINETTGCFSSLATTIQREAPPVFTLTATPVNLTDCGIFDGRIENIQVFVDGAPGVVPDFDYTWFHGNLTTQVIDGQDDATHPVDDQLTLATYPAIAVGSYFVKAIRKAGGAGVGCESAPIRRDILDDRIFPQIALSQIENTACDGNFDGQITVTASTARGPGAGANYNFIWTNDPDGAGTSFSASDALDQASPYSTPNTDLIGPGSYEVQVTNVITSCSRTGTIVLQQNTVPMEIVSVTSTDVDVCLPLVANGSGTVVDVSIGGSTGQSGLFTYTWANNPGMTAPILANDPGLTLLNLDAGTFYVRATRNAVAFPAAPGVTGSGCFTAPVPFVVQDRRVTPSVSLSQLSNTACDGNFDGQITVTASTASGPGVGANYDFVWTNDPDGAGALFSASDALNQASPYSTPNTDLIGPGSYTVQVTNVVTACSTSGSIVLQQNDAVILVVDASKTDQDICDFGGSILVEDVSINGVIDPDHNNFHFTWVANNPNNLPAIIDDVQGEDNLTVANHPTIQAGSYYVVARRADGLSGSGCESAPFRVDIQDTAVNPIPAFQTFVNSSCTGAFLNGAIRLNVRDNSGPGVGALYDYEFTYTGPNPPAGGPPFQFLGNNGNGINDGDLDSLMNLGDGTYNFIVRNQVTLCETPAQVIIQYDPVASKPNIISVDTNLPFDCLGNGGDATVTAIRIGTNAPITGSPALDPPNFQYDWYDNATDPFMNPAPAGNVPNGAPTNQRFVSMLQAGTYYVTVRDLLTECRSTPTEVRIDSVNIVYPSVVIQQTVLQLSCDPSDGTAVLQATADGFNDTNPNYTFTWFNSLDGTGTTVIDPWPGSQSTINDLTSGNYSVTALNAATGCATTRLFIVPPFDPKFFPKLALSGDPQSSCLVDNGSVVVRVLPFPTVNGMTYSPPYDFRVDLYNGNQLNAGLDVEPPPVAPDMVNLPYLPFSPQPGTFIADPLNDGLYTVRLIDLNTGCIVVDTTSIANDRRRPLPLVELENPLTNCDTRFNGQLSASADGRPVSNYDFSWWSALTNPPGVGDTLSTQHKLIGQNQGNYFVNIVNRASGCDTLAQGTIPVDQVLPVAPTAQLIQPNTICWEDFYPQEPLARPNGWVRAHVNNQTAGFRFEWFTGELTNTQASTQTPDTVGINYLHLTSRTYTVRAVVLTTGCSNVRSIVVPDERVLPLGAVQTTPSYCPDVSPTLSGTGSVLLNTTNSENVVLRSIRWFDESNNVSIGDGVQVFEVSPGFYRAEFLTNEFCYGEAVGEVRTEILSYNLVSANGDNNNDTWIIDCISNYPNNNVKVFNRYGVLVYEANGYDNADTVFRGIGEKGVYSMGNDLPDGTYFYIIDKRDGSKPITGFLELVR